jgi:hypothetical protein
MMYPSAWPSNHILNTLCIKVSEHFLGIEPWTVKLPNILAFFFFFGTMYQLADRYFKRSILLFLLPFAIMFCNPFLLDFFGLARGYGMSNALMGGSVYCLLRYISSVQFRWYALSIIFAMLAAYANFTLLIYWVALQGVLIIVSLVDAIDSKRPATTFLYPLAFLLLLAFAFLALCYQPLYKMQSTNQFVYWSKSSFFTNTLIDQVDKFRYGTWHFNKPSIYFAYIVVALIMCIGLRVVWKIKAQRQASMHDPLVILFLLLMMVFGINMLQSVILGTPYLTTRTALSYYVLFAFVLMFWVRDLSLRAPLARMTIVPVVLASFCFNLAFAFNMKSVMEWWFDAHTYEVMDYLQNYKKAHAGMDTVDLNTTWIFNTSFNFYTFTGHAPWLKLSALHTDVDTASQTRFLLCYK